MISHSESIKNLAASMLKIQESSLKVSKNNSNPVFRSTYADLGEYLEVLLPICVANGIWVTQAVMPTTLNTKITDVNSGEWMESSYPLLFGPKTVIDKITKEKSEKELDAQGLAAQITYARRNSLGAMFNVNAVDDDGNSAAGNSIDGIAKNVYTSEASKIAYTPPTRPDTSVSPSTKPAYSQNTEKPNWIKATDQDYKDTLEAISHGSKTAKEGIQDLRTKGWAVYTDKSLELTNVERKFEENKAQAKK